MATCIHGVGWIGIGPHACHQCNGAAGTAFETLVLGTGTVTDALDRQERLARVAVAARHLLKRTEGDPNLCPEWENLDDAIRACVACTERIAAIERLTVERDEARAALALVANSGAEGYSEGGCAWCWAVDPRRYNPSREPHLSECPVGAMGIAIAEAPRASL